MPTSPANLGEATVLVAQFGGTPKLSTPPNAHCRPLHAIPILQPSGHVWMAGTMVKDKPLNVLGI